MRERLGAAQRVLPGGGHVAWVYILISERDGHQYIGSTNDLDRRLLEHNSGLVQSTKSRRPLKLYGYQVCEDIVQARLVEKSYKESHGRLDRAIKKGLVIIVGV